jgi:integrase
VPTIRAGIDKRVHPHGFRHTHAVELVAEGAPVNVISRQLGHANSSVTARYLDHVAPAAVIETMQRRTWRVPEPAVPARESLTAGKVFA